VPYAGQPQKTVLLVFSPECRACTENWPSWKDLIGLVHGKARVVGVDLTRLGTAQYMKDHGAEDIQVVSDVDAASIVSHSLRLTPQTIVIDEEGVVRRVWTGALHKDDIAGILDVLNRGAATVGSR
jgi:hypothetical protein